MDKESPDRLGILGGTFNPVHIGHLILAQTAIETYELAKVLFIPCGVPPHKSTTNLIRAEYRLAMLRAAIEGDIRFEALDIEIQRGGVSYAADTVAEIHRLHPSSEIYFIIGSDTLSELRQWRSIHALLSLCRFVTFSRPGFDVEGLRPEDIGLPAPWAERLLANVTASRQIDVSASDVRHRVAEGMSIRYLVPREVEMYIAEHRLYA